MLRTARPGLLVRFVIIAAALIGVTFFLSNGFRTTEPMYRPGSRYHPSSDDAAGDASQQRNLSAADIDSFSDPPLYWLGTRFAGYNLQRVWGSPGYVQLAYGACAYRETHCPWPVFVEISRTCTVPMQAARQRGLRFERARSGALVSHYDNGHEHVTTVRLGQTTMAFQFAPGLDLSDKAVQHIQGASASVRAIGPGDPLPPPDVNSPPCR